MYRKVSLVWLLIPFFLLTFQIKVQPQSADDEQDIKWHYFFAQVQLYIKQSVSIIDEAGKLLEPYARRFEDIQSKPLYNTQEGINHLSIETINKLSYLQDRLNALNPPQGFDIYHQKADEALAVLISFVESSMQEAKLQEYAENYLPLLIDMSEEIKNNYQSYKLPKEYINGQQQRIDDLTLSLLKYKDFKRKITK
ncbi:MAG: hypothetical protein JW867_05270 [Candidatus Omnitrophica bacterium]|nr:hypothetical protein [Candidatus Omnitrophota bacterium]